MCGKSNEKIESRYRVIVYIMMVYFLILTFLFLPKSSLFDGPDETLSKTEKQNNGILYISLIFSIITILSIIGMYTNYFFSTEYKKEKFYRTSKIVDLIFIFISWILSIIVLSKVNKVAKYDSSLVETIKPKSTKIVIIQTFSFIFYLSDIIVYYVYITNYKEKPKPTTFTNSYTPTYQQTSTPINKTNTQTSNQSTQNNALIKTILTIQLYKALMQGIYDIRGKMHYKKIVEFFKNQQYDGLMEENQIEKEISGIILLLSIKLCTKDNIVKSLSNDLIKNKFILCEYLLELILKIIQIRIQNGKYKRTYYIIRQRTVETSFFVQMQREIESDNYGDRVKYNGVFRYRNNVNETIQIVRKRV